MISRATIEAAVYTWLSQAMDLTLVSDRLRTATAASTTTLTAAGAGWTVNAWKDYLARVLTGPAAGQDRVIASNTTERLTVGLAFSTSPGVGATFQIREDASAPAVIFEDQDAPRPAPPYLSVRLAGPVIVGHEDAQAIDDEGLQTIRGDREITASVQAFGAGALDLARRAAHALATERTRSQLALSGLCPRGTLPRINDLTQLLETSSEERAQFDAVLAFSDDYTDDVGLIEHVTGTGTFQNPPRDDFTVPFAADKS